MNKQLSLLPLDKVLTKLGQERLAILIPTGQKNSSGFDCLATDTLPDLGVLPSSGPIRVLGRVSTEEELARRKRLWDAVKDGRIQRKYATD